MRNEDMPELKKYLDNLKAQLTNPNMEEVLSVLEELTTERMAKEINARLGYAYKVKRFFGLEGIL